MTISTPPASHSPDGEQLPLRACVGIVLLNSAGLVWIGGRRAKWAGPGEPQWQLPQGGIMSGEDPATAARRELHEETGVVSADIEREIPGWLTMELPPHLVGVAIKGKYRGQRFRWFVFRFRGHGSEIDIAGGSIRKPEFDVWQWARYETLIERAPPHKRALYEAVGEALQLLPVAPTAA
jgi:putative (di)nucleoside polyphosphate hydrolase